MRRHLPYGTHKSLHHHQYWTIMYSGHLPYGTCRPLRNHQRMFLDMAHPLSDSQWLHHMSYLMELTWISWRHLTWLTGFNILRYLTPQFLVHRSIQVYFQTTWHIYLLLVRCSCILCLLVCNVLNIQFDAFNLACHSRQIILFYILFTLLYENCVI